MPTKRSTLPPLLHVATGLLALAGSGEGAGDAVTSARIEAAKKSVRARLLERRKRTTRTSHRITPVERGGLTPNEIRLNAPRATPRATPPSPCQSKATHPKVALMFLTQGTLPQEATWHAWFQDVEGLQPDIGRTTWCRQTAPIHCRPGIYPDAISSQDLFSVYVHAGPEHVFDPNSIFADRRIDDRIEAGWGRHALIDAERALVTSALDEPRNSRFVLLSESDVPLYPAGTLYQQLTHETKSRVNACFFDGSDPWRWHPAMARGEPAIHHRDWRKSPQWVTLIRKHAEVLSADTMYDAVFRQHCEYRQFDEELQQGYHCYSDEHYIPVLLSNLQMGHETDCKGLTVGADWSRGGSSPRTYLPEEVNAALFTMLRREGCDARSAIDLAPQLFFSVHTDAAVACETPPAWNASWLHSGCPLFARKFGPEAAGPVFDAITDCSNDLQITRC